ncbi:MAG: RNA methyltransferase [Tunicatimonas sp.]|uniref:TrmH family RNA methyltransferase n=1 Tax=Tunicatimonas sp. TaxID=1940096 RepID=UPI003C73C9F3
MDESQKLYQYLSKFLSESRMQRFEEVLRWRTRHFTVAVEDIYQQHNASAIIRTCDCLGIQDISIMERGNEFKLAQGMARGAEKWIDVHYYSEPPLTNSVTACLDNLKSQGYQIAAAAPHYAQQNPQSFDIQVRTAFFLGHEKRGLSEEVIDRADQRIAVPAFGFTESYNVSVAAALLLYELIARLHQSTKINWQLSEAEKRAKRIDWAKKSIQNVEKILERYEGND